jgi:hypothetical protein
MKDVIKSVTISGKNYDIQKKGASLAIECQSIFTTIIKESDISLDDDTKGLDMMSSMTRDIVVRIKYVFTECIASPKITIESFEDLPPSVIPKLFLSVYDYQTKEAEAKKKDTINTPKSPTNSEKKN